MQTMQTMLALGFECGICEGSISATLYCQGDLDELDGYPRVPIQCPHCARTNDVTFDSEGAVHHVVARPRPITEPNWN